MTQKAELELPEEMVGEPYLEESSPFPSVRSNYKPDSLVAKNAAVSGAVDDMAAVSFGARGKIRRSEARAQVSATLWLTSLHKPADTSALSSTALDTAAFLATSESSLYLGPTDGKREDSSR